MAQGKTGSAGSGRNGELPQAKYGQAKSGPARSGPADRFLPGDFLPPFVASAPHNPRFHLHTTAGMRLLLFFPGDAAPALYDRLVSILAGSVSALAARQVRLLLVAAPERRAEAMAARDRLADCTLLWDEEGRIGRDYGLSDNDGGRERIRPTIFLLRENLQLLARFDGGAPTDLGEGLATALRRMAPPPEYRQAGMQPPILLVPDVLPPALCRDLIAYYERDGGSPSGFMRDLDGRTVGLHDPAMKRRRDCTITDPTLLGALRALMLRRVVPEVRKAFCFEITRVERFIVARYGADEQGFFRAHRDNTSRGTAHRRFAMTVNLNADGFEGGELTFPEYGRALHRPPTGTALVFSCSLLHEARPVTAGTRYAFLPFFYDDPGAEVRRRNLAYLGPTEPEAEDGEAEDREAEDGP